MVLQFRCVVDLCCLTGRESLFLRVSVLQFMSMSMRTYSFTRGLDELWWPYLGLKGGLKAIRELTRAGVMALGSVQNCVGAA